MKFRIEEISGEKVLSECSLKYGETEVVIPDGVTVIGSLDEEVWRSAYVHKSAFTNNSKGLTSVVIPKSVTKIGVRAFYGCTGLTSIIIPDSVKKIGHLAFYGCTSLTSIVLPKVELKKDVLAGCTSLKEIIGIEIPIANYPVAYKPMALVGFFRHPELYTNSEVVDGYRNYCSKKPAVALEVILHLDCAMELKELFADKNKITVKNFEEKFLKPAQDANAAQCVAFLLDWKNQNISSEEEFKHLERELKKAPYNVADMKKLWKYSKNEDETICIHAYKGSETEVEIPAQIGKAPVTSIVEKRLQKDDSFFNCFFNNAKEIKSVTIPAGVKKIGKKVFIGCCSLTNVVIPNSVKEIGDDAFWNCTGLTSIVIPDSVKKIGEYAFNGCTGLTSVLIPNGVKKLGMYAFAGCKGLTYIAMSNSVKEIGNGAFRGCSGLTNIAIPDSVKRIEGLAFYGCTSLTSIVIPEGVEEIGWKAFLNCTGLKSIIVNANNPSYSCDERGVLLDKEKVALIWYPSGNTAASYNIPNSVKEIGDEAFAGCTSLKIVAIPDSVEKIDSEAFKDCTNLASIVISNNVKEIGYAAFKCCRSLTSIVIPEGVKKIESHAFESCTNLTSIVIPKGVEEIDYDAFEKCKRLTSVVIPDSVKEIGNAAFWNCTALTSIVIPKSVKKIGDWAFEGCDLKKLVIHTPSGSYAERYAQRNGIKFERTDN